MKKILIVISVAILTLSAFSCGNNTETKCCNGNNTETKCCNGNNKSEMCPKDSTKTKCCSKTTTTDTTVVAQ